MRTSIRSSTLLAFVVAIAFLTSTVASAAGPTGIPFSISGTNGSGTTTQPGTPCTSGGTGASWAYDYSATIPSGTVSSLATQAAFHLEIHSEGSGEPASYSGAFILPSTSYVTLTNTRGTATLGFNGGTCGVNTLAFNGTNASGSGAWTVLSGATGSYRDLTGSGTFTILNAQVAAGSNNPFQLAINGNVDVLDTGLDIEFVKSSWAKSSDPKFHRAQVVYRIKNVGLGDAFGVKVTGDVPQSSSAVALSTLPKAVGDIPAGGSALVTLEYRIDKPCKGGCPFTTTLSVDLPDALDVSNVSSDLVTFRTPSR